MGRFQIAVFPGDGIGHEVMAPTLALLKKLEAGVRGFELAFQSYEAGAGLYQRTGAALASAPFARALRGLRRAHVTRPERQRSSSQSCSSTSRSTCCALRMTSGSC